MKKLSYFAAAMLMFAACSSDDEITENIQNVNSEKGVITVSMPQETRVSTENLGAMIWEAGDQLKVIQKTAMGDPMDFKVFSMTSEPGKATANFTGEFVNGSAQYVFVYMHDGMDFGDMDGKCVGVPYKDQHQNGFNTKHIKDCLSMSGKATKDQLDKVVLKPNNAVMKINVKYLPEELRNATETVLEWFINDELKTKLTFAGTMDFSKTDNNNYLYMGVNPAYELNAGGKVSFKFTANGVSKTISGVTKKTNGVDYMPGKIYTVTITDGAEEGSLKWE